MFGKDKNEVSNLNFGYRLAGIDFGLNKALFKIRLPNFSGEPKKFRYKTW